MDEIYSNLDNYNEVNIVEELKNENKELKYKLEEYSNTLKQLQTDFDRLHSEYKKLELNFSSLLKTARAEIERKTQLITNLNREKDNLVIKSMQNGQINILRNLTHNRNRGVYNKKDNNKNEGDKEFTNLNKTKLGVKTETRDVSRIEPHLTSPIESVSSIGTTIKSTSSETNLRTNNKHSSDIKENILKKMLDQQHKDPQTDKKKPMKVMDRRKSMPVLSNWEEQFSSDEEEVGNLKRHQDYEKKSNKDLPYGRTQKVTEQTCYDSKNKYNERYTDKSNPYADQHTRSRHRTHYRHSPQRDIYKSQRRSDNSYRPDYRQRILKSPPLDKYDRSRSRNRRYREKDYERDYDNYNVNHNSRNEYYSEDRAYSKEPDVKRRRIESTSTDTERYDRFIDRKSCKHSEYPLDVYRDNHTSCQSPDYEQIESSLTLHLVKEVMDTADVQLEELEDPRIKSNKYLPDKSNKGSFITAVGVNVPIIPIDRTHWGLEKIEVPEALKEKPSVVTSNDDLLNYIYMDIDEPAQNTSAKEYRQDPRTDSEGYTPAAPATPTQITCNYKEDIDLTKACHESDSCGKANDKVSKTLSSHYKIPKKSETDSYKNISHKEQDTKNEIRTDDKSMRKDEKTSPCNSLGTIIDIQNIEHSSNIELNNKARRLTPCKDNIARDLELSDEGSDIMDDIQIAGRCDNELNINTPVNTQTKVDKTLKDEHKSSTVQDDKHIEKNKQKTSKDKILEIREGHDEVVNKICKEKKSENIEEAQKTICNDDNLELNANENNSKIVEEKIPKQVEECKKKSSKKKHKEKKATEKLDECEKTKTLSKHTRKTEKKKKVSKDDTDKQKNVIVIEEKNTKKLEEIKSSKPKNKFTELFGESSSLITPDDLGIVKYDLNNVRDDNYGSLFENTQDAIDLNVSEIQKAQNTKEIASDVALLPKTTEDQTQIPCAIDNKSVFKVEEKHSGYNIFKNLTPAPIDSECNVVKTVVISSGVQNIAEEKEGKQKNLPEHKSNNGIAKLANKQLPVELLRAVATSTPNKIQCEISSRLTEESSPKGESLSNADVSLSDATDVGGVENNAPDVRIFLKRRRKIRKT